MDNAIEKINQILQNPDSMKQIMDMAQTMGLNMQNEDNHPEESMDNMFSQISKIMKKTDGSIQRQETLIRALLPYLNPRRQARLERAMQLSQFSRVAGTALQDNPMFSFKDGDEEHV